MLSLRSLIFTTPFIIVVSGCSTSTTPPPPKVTASTPEPVIVHKEFEQVLGSNFRGTFTYEDGVSTFQACNDKQEYNVIENKALLKVYNKLSKQPAQPVYIEFSGELNFTETLSSDLPIMLRADRVQHMALAKSSLQCAKPFDTFDFKAKGETPYWRINMHDNKLFFATRISNQSYTLKEANYNSYENNRSLKTNRLNASNADGQNLSLDIIPGDCYMMNDKEYWGYQTKTSSAYGQFTGCGEPGRLAIEQQFPGYYLSGSQSDGQILNLSIHDNYKVEFKQGKGKEQVVKTGYWKSNTPNTLVVMLTQEGKKAIQEEIIFKRNGLTLTSTSMNQNNILTQFDSPFTFNKMDSEDNSSGDQPVHINRQFTAQRISPQNSIDLEVQAAVRDYFKIHRTDPKNTQFNSVRFDLNGDGKDEAIVMLDWCAKAKCEMLIFENKENALRFSSRVSRVKAPITVSQSQYFSWQSLSTKQDDKTALRLDFDGLSYPRNTRDAKSVSKAGDSTGVILFNKGNPTVWFPIK